jgi:hypothetical protein
VARDPVLALSAPVLGMRDAGVFIVAPIVPASKPSTVSFEDPGFPALTLSVGARVEPVSSRAF